MKDLIVLILDFLICTYIFEHIYLFWNNRLRPSIQNYHASEKSLFADLRRHICISLMHSAFLNRNFPGIMRHVFKPQGADSKKKIVNSGWKDLETKWNGIESEWKV